MRRVMRRTSRPSASRSAPPTANAAVDAQAQRAAAILAVVRQVPRGRVTTYGAVAARAGLPRQARLVGKVLAGLPDNSGVPWQRVVAAGGRIAFPPGSAPRERQIACLRDEQVDAPHGRVDLARHGWGTAMGDLDQLLWSGE
jgi:methylated-DNA-protein-cysteine methyltransferase-like protein